MNAITIDLDQLTAVDLAMLSKVISRQSRQPINDALYANCGKEHGRSLQGRALTLLDELDKYDAELAQAARKASKQEAKS